MAGRDREEVKKRKRDAPTLSLRVVKELLAWMEAPLYWQGRVVWLHKGQEIKPDGKLIGKSQRRLNMLQSEKKAAGKLDIDLAQWVPAQQRLIEQTKFLSSLDGTFDRQDPEYLRKMVNLIAAEAVCLNMPFSPSMEVWKFGVPAEGPLVEFCRRPDLPDDARRLAVMTVGALRSSLPANRKIPFGADNETYRRTYYWGMKYGLCEESRIFNLMLKEADGIELSEKLIKLLAGCKHFHLPPQVANRLLHSDLPPYELVKIVTALSVSQATAEKLLRYRDLLPPPGFKDREAVSQILKAEREKMLSVLTALILDVIELTRDAQAIVHVTSFIENVLTKLQPTEDMFKSLLLTLQTKDWVCADYLRFLELLTGFAPRFLEQDGPKTDSVRKLRPAKSDQQNAWYHQHIFNQLMPLKKILAHTEDVELTLAAYATEAQKVLTRFPPALAKSIVYLAKSGMSSGALDWSLAPFLGRVEQAGLSPLRVAEQIRGATGTACLTCYSELFVSHLAPGEINTNTLDEALEIFAELVHLGEATHSHHEDLGRLFDDMAFTFKRTKGSWLKYSVWFGQQMTQRYFKNQDTIARKVFRDSLSAGLQLGLAIAGDDFTLFRAVAEPIVAGGLNWKFASELPQMVKVVDSSPTLAAMLARLIPQNPLRCLDLVGELAAASRIFEQKTDTFIGLKRDCNPQEAGWQKIIELAPDLNELVLDYVSASQFLNRNAGPPSSLQAITRLDDDFKQELRYLEQIPSPKTSILRRRAHLEIYLADEPRLRNHKYKLLKDKLQQLTAELQLTAIKGATDQNYKARLKMIVGDADIELNDDWRNAVRLDHATSKLNRRVLRRLINAVAHGKPWLEEHFGNQKFLKELAEHGVDTQVWMGSFDHTYDFEGLAYDTISLSLETDPLKVLQMGNYVQTCLQVTGCNNFAVIVNATEANKRVIYARDGKGRIVARKLIGFNDAYKLVGYETYTWLSKETGQDAALEAVFNQYCRQLAEKANIELSNDGHAVTLFCQHSYDDGVRNWDAPPQPQRDKHA